MKSHTGTHTLVLKNHIFFSFFLQEKERALYESNLNKIGEKVNHSKNDKSLNCKNYTYTCMVSPPFTNQFDHYALKALIYMQ